MDRIPDLIVLVTVTATEIPEEVAVLVTEIPEVTDSVTETPEVTDSVTEEVTDSAPALPVSARATTAVADLIAVLATTRTMEASVDLEVTMRTMISLDNFSISRLILMQKSCVNKQVS